MVKFACTLVVKKNTANNNERAEHILPVNLMDDCLLTPKIQNVFNAPGVSPIRKSRPYINWTQIACRVSHGTHCTFHTI